MPDTPAAPTPSAPDVRAYLEIRTAGPAGFSPDATKLLVSSNLPGTSQLYRMHLADVGGAPPTPAEFVQLTDFDEPVGGGYLPTRDELLLAMDVGGNERHQLYLMDDRAESEGGSGPRELVTDPEHIHRPGGVTRDGRLLAYATNRRNGTDFDVWVRDLSTGRERPVYAEGGWCGAAGFSPDGRWLAVSRLTERPGDNEVHLVAVDGGGGFELVPHPGEGQEATVGTPTWLPDSSAFLFSHSVGTEFTVIARHDMATGVTETVLDLGWDAGCAVDWTGRHLLVVANVDGYTRAWLHDPVTVERRQEITLPGDGTAGGWRFSHDGRLLTYAFSSPLVPGDVWLHDLELQAAGTSVSRRLTESPNDVDPETFVEPELVRVPTPDGEQVPAFVFRPREALPAGARRPVVVMIHGGPESQYRPSFSGLTQYLVAAGFAVVAPNVRGSTGYGKRFEHLDDVDRRLDSVADLAALHDWIATTDDLDPGRAALYGGSYGGYMVLCGLAFQPQRWAAGVDIVGMSSLVTFLENTAVWRRRFREREYGSLEHDRDLLEAASPINRVNDIRAPLFLIHGANDPRVPLGEAEQIAAILEGKGVRCDLRVYHDEGHGLAKLANRVDAYPRVVEFLAEVLAP